MSYRKTELAPTTVRIVSLLYQAHHRTRNQVIGSLELKPSECDKAVGALEDAGHLIHDDEFLTLTKSGREWAEVNRG